MKRFICPFLLLAASPVWGQSTDANNLWTKLQPASTSVYALSVQDVNISSDTDDPSAPLVIKAKTFVYKQTNGETEVRKWLANFGRYLSLRRSDPQYLRTETSANLQEYLGRKVFAQTHIARSYYSLAQTARDRSMQCALFQRSSRERQKLLPLLTPFLKPGVSLLADALPKLEDLQENLPASIKTEPFKTFLKETLDPASETAPPASEIKLKGIIETLNANCALVSISNQASLRALIQSEINAILKDRIATKVTDFKNSVTASSLTIGTMKTDLLAANANPQGLYVKIFDKDTSVGQVSFSDAIANARTNFDMAYTDGLGFAAGMENLKKFYERNKCKKASDGTVSCEAASYPLIDVLAKRITGCLELKSCTTIEADSLPDRMQKLDQKVGLAADQGFKATFMNSMSGSQVDLDALNKRYVDALKARDQFKDFQDFRATNQAVSDSMTALTKRLMNL